MAQAIASMAGLRGSTQAVLEGSLQLSGSSRLANPARRVSVSRTGTNVVRAQQGEGEAAAHTSRRAALGLVAAGLAGGSFVQAVLADAKPIKLGPPPPPSGGLLAALCLVAANSFSSRGAVEGEELPANSFSSRSRSHCRRELLPVGRRRRRRRGEGFLGGEDFLGGEHLWEARIESGGCGERHRRRGRGSGGGCGERRRRRGRGSGGCGGEAKAKAAARGEGCGERRGNFTVDDMDIAWKHCKPEDPNNRKGRLICNYCLKGMSGGVFRMKNHLAGISGNVAPCQEVPSEIKKEIIQHLRIKKKEQQAAKITKDKVMEELLSQPVSIDPETDESDEDDESRDIRIAMRESRQEQEVQEQRRRDMYLGVGSSRGATGSGHASTGSSHGIMHVQSEQDPNWGGSKNKECPTLDHFVQKKQSSKQPKMKAALQGLKDVRKKMGRSIARFFIYNHIPFNAADSPSYHGMVRDIAEVGTGIKPPTPYDISHTYLDEEYVEYKQYLTTYHAFWDEYGCTLMCDGWTTQNKRSIINFLVYCPLGTVFLKSVDASAKFKSGNYICKLMKQVITEIGESRVVQVVTDNGANYKLAGKKLMLECPNLYWTPCAAHCIDLMLEDIAKEAEVRPTIEKSQKLTNFIYNHGWALSIMRKETRNGELIRPAITRFATHFLALQSILQHRHDLVRTVTSREWQQSCNRLSRKDKQMADEIYSTILNGEYWADITIITGIFGPLVKVLRMVDSDDKAEMGFLYEAMDRAKEGIRNNVGNGYQKWWHIVDNRWERLLHRDIHAAGYFLNPQYQYHRSVQNDEEVISGFRHVVDRLVTDATTRLDIKKEAEKWRLKIGIFGLASSKNAIKRTQPAEWWSIIAREETPNLARLAVRVLSQTVSSSNCERNWTTFTLIHTRPRNRLTMERLEKLVFVHYNMRLRQRAIKRKETEETLIDLDNIFHEEDPLGEWIREREDCLLDDRDNSWLDEAIEEDEALDRNATAERRRKGKHAATTEESKSQDSSDDDDSGDSQAVHTHAAPTTTSHDQSHDQEHSYGHHHGHQYSGMDDAYTGIGRHDVREEPSDSDRPFDNMMSSFFDGTQISHYYPHEPQRYDGQEDHNATLYPQVYPPALYLPHHLFHQHRPDQDNDDQNVQLEPHRSSFWW